MRGYVRLELMRLVRSPGYLISSIAMPLVLYLIFSNLGSGSASDRHDIAVYLMVSMAAFGAVGGALMNGMIVVQDRSIGWLRQLRVTPLSPGRVVIGRGLTGMIATLPAILVVCVLGGAINDIGLPMARWVEIVALLWLGTAPFALLGLGIGYLITAQAAQPVMMLLNFGMSILGGLWVPATEFPTFLRQVSKIIPTSGYGNIARQIAANAAPHAFDVAVLVGWFVVFAVLAGFAYRRAGRSTV
jgi:ABC-2 type transport system permease protein